MTGPSDDITGDELQLTLMDLFAFCVIGVVMWLVLIGLCYLGYLGVTRLVRWVW